MNPTKIFPKPVSFRYLMSVCIGVLGLLGVLHLFMTMYVLPHFEGFLDVYIAARNGGRSYFMHADWFATFSGIFIAAILVAVIVIVILARRHRQAAATLTVALLIVSAVYLATFIGNAFYQLWGVWVATLGIIALVVGVFAVEFPLILSLADPHSRFVKK